MDTVVYAVMGGIQVTTDENALRKKRVHGLRNSFLTYSGIEYRPAKACLGDEVRLVVQILGDAIRCNDDDETGQTDVE
jgi:hypothetical protein